MATQMTENRTSIEKAILEVVSDKWMTIPQIESKISTKLGIDPDALSDLVALYTGILVGDGELEDKEVTPTGAKDHFYMCRKKGQTHAN